jgi:hypothetical protein
MKVSLFVYEKGEMLMYSCSRRARASETNLSTPSARGRKGTRQEGDETLQICLKG